MDAALLAPHDVQPADMQRSAGRIDIAWRRRGATTAAARTYQEGAAKVRLPRDHGRGCPDAALINLAGGLTGGDCMDYRLHWQPGTCAGATTQAAEKVYRAADGEVSVTTRLEVGAGAWAEWLPQETILFDRAALDRRLVLDLAADARVLAVEPVVFGRLAMGERMPELHLRDRIEVRIGGGLAWFDATLMTPPLGALLDHPALGGGARAMATLLYIGPDALERLPLVRALLDETAVAAAATCLDHVLVARLHDAEPLALRRALVHVLTGARAALSGLPARLPRLWHT